AIANVGFFMHSVTYLNYAMALVGKNLDWGNVRVNHEQVLAALSRRTVGYPLLLVLTRTPWILSLRTILIVQALMAIAMPLLIFKTLQPFSRYAAFLTAL